MGTDTNDPPVCGDPTCEGSGCRQSAIDAWDARMQNEARAIVRFYMGLPAEEDQ